MKYIPIDSSLFVLNRSKLTEHLKPNSIAVFNSNDVMPSSADGTLPFRQHSDIIYLSGIDQEESILVVYPDAIEEKHREILFLRETNDEIAVWEGHKYTKDEAHEASGVRTVYWLKDFERIFRALAHQAEHIYLNTNEHLRAASPVETRDMRFVTWCRKQFPLHKYERLQPVMHHLRAVKSEQEIDLLRKAIDITEKGFRRVLKFVKPGVAEYEIEAEFIHEFLINRATGFGFEPIVASGANACVLHYVQNNDVCKDGDCILFDVGAQYAHYNGDLSRAVPVSGRYTRRQREVYEAVWRIQREAMQLLKPGVTIPEYHKQVGKITEEELMQLGLLTKEDIAGQDPEWPAYKKYFMHGTSHHLGIDVHDYGLLHRAIEPGMVFTVEPGIYIREEGLGIRLENDIVIREGGFEDLMSTIPIDPDEIESLMNS
jgi:Xaa-Pro aminopeptidase